MIGDNHEAGRPFVGAADLKSIQDTPQKCSPTGFMQTYQQESMMGTGLKTTNVEEIQVLCDQETPGLLSGLPDDGIITTRQSLLRNGVNVVSQCRQAGDQGGRQILIEFDLHAT